jgi:hypothetical protein
MHLLHYYVGPYLCFYVHRVFKFTHLHLHMYRFCFLLNTVACTNISCTGVKNCYSLLKDSSLY